MRVDDDGNHEHYSEAIKRMLKPEERHPFSIKQYEGGGHLEERAQQLVCRKCGGERFHIAKADYFTAVRCIYCKTEVCVHEG